MASDQLQLQESRGDHADQAQQRLQPIGASQGVTLRSAACLERFVVLFELHDQLQNDDHNSAALWIRSDGRYLASYSTHTTGGTPAPGVTTPEAQQVRFRISEPHNPNSWSDEETHNADGFRITTYSNLHYLPDDDAGGGRLYNFHRNVGFDPHVLVSADHGDTWTEWGNLFTFGGDSDRPYVKYASNGDKIHFTTTEAHPESFNASIYAGYVKNGQLFGSAGLPLDSDLSSGTPVNATELTPVFDVNSAPYRGVYSRAWTVDQAIDSGGNPYAVFQARIDPGAVSGPNDPSDHQYFYARFDGEAWSVKELAKAGDNITHSNGGSGYTGLVALHPHDPNRLFMSTIVDPRDGLPTTRFEIYEGVTEDEGGSWTWSAITENSTMDNVRPIVPEWDDSCTALLWMRGSYPSYTQWSTEVVGLIFDDAPNADFNHDLAVDGDDLTAWKTGFGTIGSAAHGDGDADGDQDVDGADFLIWQRQLGSAPVVAASAAVPEPATLMLIVLAAAGASTVTRPSAHFRCDARNWAVPEPSTLVQLISVAGGACLTRRRTVAHASKLVST